MGLVLGSGRARTHGGGWIVRPLRKSLVETGAGGVQPHRRAMLKAEGRRIAVIAAGTITFLNLYNVQALLPTLAREFALPLPQTRLAVTATLLAVALVAPFAGSISDMLGRKRLIVSAMWGLTVPTLLCATATGLPTLVVWRFVQGLLLPFILDAAVEPCAVPPNRRIAWR